MRLTESASVPLSVGVDIGGSKVLAVALDESREVLAQVRLRTGTGAEGVVESAVEAVHRLATRTGVRPEDFCVVGVGVPGLVEAGSGDVSHAVNLDLGEGVLRLGPLLSARLGVPVVVENDVNAAALGAARLLGLDDSDLAFLSIGTGLAAGLVTGGRVRRGARGAAGEVGHIPVDPAGLPCPCGQRGCLETLASGSAIAAAWPGHDGRPPASALFAAAADGDHRAIEVRDRFAEHVAAAVRLLVLTCDVERVVLGGGVTEVGPALLDAVKAALRRQAAGSPFLAALDLPDRVAVVPVRSAVAAVGAALCGVVAYAAGETGEAADDTGRQLA
jgi:predicted NBD/HSP70 family sugar kinase